jgi:preprotein translocase subunit YajC
MINQVIHFFVSDAYAQSAGLPAPGSQGGSFSFVLMFVVFFLFIYFAIWRPQNKRAKEQKAMLDALAKGDEVITAGGLLGRITKMTGSYMVLTIANNVDIWMQKSSVVSVLPKGTLKSIE